MTENILHTPYHQQVALSKAGDVISQHHPALDNVHLKLARINSIDRQTGKVGITGLNDHSVNGNRIKKTEEHIQLPVQNYGVNTDGNPYGTFPQVGIGDKVLLGYVYGNEANPIVIRIYPDENLLQHITPTKQGEVTNNVDNFDDYRAQKEVFPSQQVELKKGQGDYERTLNGNSFIARLDPSNGAIWRSDQYDGSTLDAAYDQSTGQPYQIQNQNAQDWVKVHQSNTPFDNHITKRMITQDGSIHNYLGSHTFTHDAMTEDASMNNGYTLQQKSGKIKEKTPIDIKHLIKYAKKQIGHHLYGSFNVNKKTPRKSNHKGYDIYKGKLIKSDSWGFKDGIKYDSKYGPADCANFVASCLRKSGFDKRTFGGPLSAYSLYYGLQDNYKMPIKAGDVAFKLSEKPVFHEGGYKNVPLFSKPFLLVEKYHGDKTKVIGESKKHKNVIETTLANVYSDLGPQGDGSVNYLVFARPTKTVVPSTKFHLDHNGNFLNLSVTDPKIPGWRHRNALYIHNDSAGLYTMGHSITLNRHGIYLDNHKYNPLEANQKISALEDNNQRLQSKFNNLVSILKKKKILPSDYKD